MSGPDALELLGALVEAHAVPDPNTRSREPILYMRFLGGAHIKHHALGTAPEADEAVLEELARQGYVDIDYRKSTWLLTPTVEGRALVEQHKRVLNAGPTADLQPILNAVSSQVAAVNRLGWAGVRPVLAALRSYWEEAGFPPEGIQLAPFLKAVPKEHKQLFVATVRALVSGGYLMRTTELGVNDIPGEVAFTDRAHTVLDGWPGATPAELVENLLAVLTSAAAEEQNPKRKRRLEGVAESIRELGVSTASEVLAKVVLGA